VKKRVGFDQNTNFIAVEPWHHEIGEDDIRLAIDELG
jgi:hypothetical protein